jgi:hypothetical protein
MNVDVRLAEIWSERLGIPFNQGHDVIIELIDDVYPNLCLKLDCAYERLFSSILFYELLNKPWFIGFLHPNTLICYACLNDDYVVFFKGGGKFRKNISFADPLLLQWVKDFDRMHSNNRTGTMKRRFNA